MVSTRARARQWKRLILFEFPLSMFSAFLRDLGCIPLPLYFLPWLHRSGGSAIGGFIIIILGSKLTLAARKSTRTRCDVNPSHSLSNSRMYDYGERCKSWQFHRFSSFAVLCALSQRLYWDFHQINNRNPCFRLFIIISADDSIHFQYHLVRRRIHLNGIGREKCSRIYLDLRGQKNRTNGGNSLKFVQI